MKEFKKYFHKIDEMSMRDSIDYKEISDTIVNMERSNQSMHNHIIKVSREQGGDKNLLDKDFRELSNYLDEVDELLTKFRKFVQTKY